MRMLLATCAGAWLTAAVPALAQDAADPRPAPAVVTSAETTRHRHLGLFLRPDVGVGYASMKTSQGGLAATIDGPAATFGIAAGTAFSENGIVALHVWEAMLSNPSISMGGLSAPGSATATLFGVGPEYTAYSSQNLYLSLCGSLTRMSLQTGGKSADTDWGVGLRAAIGKEWWAGDHLGLGVVGHFSVSFNQDAGDAGPLWTSWAGGLAFSATYN